MERKIIYKEWIDEIIGLVKKSEIGNMESYELALLKSEDINRAIHASYTYDRSIVYLVNACLQHNKGKQEVYRMVELLGFLVISKKEAKAVRNGREIL